MKIKLLTLSTVVLFLTSCSKTIDKAVSGIVNPQNQIVTPAITNEYVKYTIKQGEQFCDNNAYTAVKYKELAFKVKFDSSAIYQTILPSNQKDINKLYGFSDNNAQHHQFSARFGWRWSDNALRLFAYIYNDSKLNVKEVSTVKIGEEYNCSIKVTGENYVFTVNETSVTMPRTSVTAIGEGYKLYPYFGGDEMAPHSISIWIKE